MQDLIGHTNYVYMLANQLPLLELSEVSNPLPLRHAPATAVKALAEIQRLGITPILDPKATFFYWTVPNMPTNAAVRDIRFGGEGWYPECFAPQTASTFVISQTTGQLY